jgi:hypothetical protein
MEFLERIFNDSAIRYDHWTKNGSLNRLLINLVRIASLIISYKI